MLWRLTALLALVSLSAWPTTASADNGGNRLGAINHIVVIYEENHSFDNLYGGWEGVNGLANADAAHTTQKSQTGVDYSCLLLNDVNLVVNPGACSLPNTHFTIDNYISPTDSTCPPTPLDAFSHGTGWLKGTGAQGGCTRDIVHRFYQEQYQLDGGRQDRYVTGSDAVGLAMGVYDTRSLPIYQYLHQPSHPHYAISDNFFQAAFGGSFLNHQWLIAAASPTYAGARASLQSIVDSNGFPKSGYPLYSTSGVADTALTVACPPPTPVAGLACGDYVVNTAQPTYQPSGAFGLRIPPQTNPTIGDRLTGAGVDWAWYSGGWSNASGDVDAPGWTNGSGPTCGDPYVDPIVSSYPRCPSNVFQYHHQPFNYYTAFNTTTTAGIANRAAHLRDEQEFMQLAEGSSKTCQLKPVSFIKPFGLENEHPGYASEPDGSSHLVNLLKGIDNSACRKDTMVVVTYDEFGGQWDHVSPPGQGGAPGAADQWGPGTRIPALIVTPRLRGNFVVDHTQYDTTSILATIEHRFGLLPLSTRDAAVNDLGNVFNALPSTA